MKTANTEAPPAAALDLMGRIVWLLSQAPGYEDAELDRIDALFFKPLLHDQLRVFMRNGRPVGLVAWAHLSAEAEARYLETGLLQPEDWRSGDRFWFTDFLAPFGNVAALTRTACQFIPPGTMGRGTRRAEDGTVRRITRHRHHPARS